MLALSKDQEFMDLIVKLNTEKQLFDKGINSQGIRLEKIGALKHDGYSPSTILGIYGLFDGKIAKGQPIDRITLKDGGNFYASFRVILNSNHDLQITANPIKAGIDILERWGKEVIGLTDENLQIVIDFARIKVQNIVKYQLLKAA